jgi:predicted kinase
VLNIAQERMKVRLRAGQPVVWNATNLARTQRQSVIDLATAYGARVDVVVVEAAADVIAARNRARSAPVPASAYARLMARWEFPDLREAHRVIVVDDAHDDHAAVMGT